MSTREHPPQLRAQAQETWRQIFNEELRMFESEAAWADYVRSTLSSARELGDAVERSGECQTEHLQCVVRPSSRAGRSAMRANDSIHSIPSLDGQGQDQRQLALADLHSEFTLWGSTPSPPAPPAPPPAAAAWAPRLAAGAGGGGGGGGGGCVGCDGGGGGGCDGAASSATLRSRTASRELPEVEAGSILFDVGSSVLGSHMRRSISHAAVVENPLSTIGAGGDERKVGWCTAQRLHLQEQEYASSSREISTPAPAPGCEAAGGAVVSAFSPSSSYGLYSVDAAGGDREQVSRRVTTDTQFSGVDGSDAGKEEVSPACESESMRSASSLNPSSADPHSATRTDLRSIPQMPAESPGSWWSAESRQRSRELNSREVSL